MANNPEQVISPLWIDQDDSGNPKYDAAGLRAIFSTLFSPGSEIFQAKPGIVSGLEITTDPRSITVKPGVAIVNNTRGSFITGLKQSIILPVGAPHQTLPRKDLLVLEVKDIGTERGGALRVIKGSPDNSPTVASTPASCLAIAAISVPAKGALSVQRLAAKVGLRNERPVRSLPLSAGASSGQVVVAGQDKDVTVTLRVCSSGQDAPIGSIGQAVNGCGLVRGSTGSDRQELWPVVVVDGQIKICPPPPRGVWVSGSFSVGGV